MHWRCWLFVIRKAVHLRYGKKGDKKLATSFATLMLNELKSNVALFTTQIKPTLHRGGPRGRVQGVPRPPPPPPQEDLRFSNTTGTLQKKNLWFIGVEVEQETSEPPPKKILDLPLLHQIRLLGLPGRLCCCKTSLSWASKTSNMYRFCWKKQNYSLLFATTFRNLQHLLQDSFQSSGVKRATSLSNKFF